MKTIKLLIRCIAAFFYVNDVDTFWQIREQILRGHRLSKLFNLVAKIIRKHYACAIPISANIQPFYAPHGFYGIFISKEARIGQNYTIFQHVIIGGAQSRSGECASPVVGDHVLIGAGSVVCGKVKIGNGVRIGAGAVVAQNVPDNCTVVMDKPRIITH